MESLVGEQGRIICRSSPPMGRGESDREHLIMSKLLYLLVQLCAPTLLCLLLDFFLRAAEYLIPPVDDLMLQGPWLYFF